MFKVEPIGTGMGMWGGRGARDSVGGGVGGAGRVEGAGQEGTSPAQLCPPVPPPQLVTVLCFIRLHADCH